MELPSQTQKPIGAVGNTASKVKEVLSQFMAAIDAIKKGHRVKINETLKDVDERKIRVLKEKLKNL